MGDTSSICVAVRVRPFTERETRNLISTPSQQHFLGDGSFSAGTVNEQIPERGIRRVIKVLDDNVLIFDPPDENPSYGGAPKGMQVFRRRYKDIRYAFDRLFDDTATQEDVYRGTAQPLLQSIMEGINATVFAYGATGCGKTHTISGRVDDPGIIFLTMRDLFERMEQLRSERTIKLELTYLEIYNETIRDLLDPDNTSTSHRNLNLRESSDHSITVPGLTVFQPTNLDAIMDIIIQGNANRTMSATEANAVSSRSHAVLQIHLKQTLKNNPNQTLHSTLSVIDLAGSERASATKNRGERLIEGANINRSLLALGNCINALCDPRRRQHVPYRDSKLTRLLKFSLGGNCKTVMIVCVSPSSEHYEETHNTLKYGNRAKNIKTKTTQNVLNVDLHINQYVSVIQDLRQRVAFLHEKLAQKTQNSAASKDYIKAKMFETKMKEARSLLKSAFEGSQGLLSDMMKSVRELRRLEDDIKLVKIWLDVADKENTFSNEYIMLAKDHLDSLYTQRSVVTSNINPEEICKSFQNSVSHIIAAFRAEDCTMYADMLQDEVDLLKSIVENQILDTQHESEFLPKITRRVLRNMFLMFPAIAHDDAEVNEELASALDSIIEITPTTKNFRSKTRTQYQQQGASPRIETIQSPRRWKARSPTKSSTVLKPLKKRVRFSSATVPASNAVLMPSSDFSHPRASLGPPRLAASARSHPRTMLPPSPLRPRKSTGATALPSVQKLPVFKPLDSSVRRKSLTALPLTRSVSSSSTSQQRLSLGSGLSTASSAPQPKE
ncbi:kinesin-like protein Klp6 [Schizosaccharomyces japonicus yFS275]|uniref:Kinesin-like protein n=1 Tax=Schizosaccharomyces japonicus (strain yFS275 / FY16936) TaxID=402676 RepID=B6K270_SCHJY|nr:kinesin-like protein Klp6 [Schizosaccharomyces japonicus yFS275]EEB07251.1 kinesin-like protein Klp6 [Schizosaccharomyces japonicus yFS275]